MTTLFYVPLSLVLLLAISFLEPVHAHVNTSRLQFHIPKSLSREGGWDHRDALFGIPPYGGSIQEKVYYANSTLCDTVDPKSGFPVETDDNGLRLPWKPPYILMIDRGECSFVQKVRNAQRTGAAAVLIADNICLCLHTDCQMNPEQLVCETQEPIMADDGSGADITIPSFLVFKPDADLLKQTLMKDQQVRCEMAFSVPAPDARVEYDLWTTPADPISKPFLKEFSIAAEALSEHAHFTPHEFVYDGTLAHCDTGDDIYCEGLCTNGGRYCASDPDGDLDSGISGSDVVQESLRRICIWNLYGKDGIGEAWWTYVQSFMANCDDPEQPKFTDEACIATAYLQAAIDKSAIDKCMDDSGGLVEAAPNTLLDAAVKQKEFSGALLIPSLFVNHAPIRGEMVLSTVFKAICSGFANGHEPEICKSCAFCHKVEQCLIDEYCATGYDESEHGLAVQGVSPTLFLGSLLAVTLTFSVVGYIVYTRQQRHMRDQVRGIMAEYMPIDPSKAQRDNRVSDDNGDLEFSIS